MAYIPGEERVTKMIPGNGTVTEVYRFLEALTDRPDVPAIERAFGSTRFEDSHGYVAFNVKHLHSVPIWKLQRKFPRIEFKLTHYRGRLYVEFRTKGSTGWHPGANWK